jgi:hypothetical protein
MMIKIDLKDLTQAHFDAALPHLGACRYASPCIIGTLIPEDQRADLDKKGEHGNPTVRELIREGLLELPDGQFNVAVRLQSAFDNGEAQDFQDAWDEMQKALHP